MHLQVFATDLPVTHVAKVARNILLTGCTTCSAELMCSTVPQIMTDFSACRWPKGMQDEAIARHLDELNDEGLAAMAEQQASSPGPVISFSHFLPLQVLLDSATALYVHRV